MKTIFRFLSAAMLLAAVIAIGSVTGFAQAGCDDTAGKADLDSKFRTNYSSKDIATREIAVNAGKQYIEKYGECPDSKEFVDYLKANIPPMEERIKKEKAGALVQGRYNKFDAAYKAQNWDDVYAAGKDILAAEPDNLDVILVLGSIGYDQSFKKNYKYNDDTVRYAKLAIQKINSGTTSKNWGVFDIKYKSKEDALGWMNLTIGYITYYAQNNKKEALPYLYAASLANSDTKTNPIVFEPVGAYYFEDVKRLADEVQAMIKDQTASAATDTDEVKAKKDADIKAKIALLNGTTERAMDAYARAYNLAKANPKTKAYSDGLYKQIQALYNVRFQKTTGVDEYITATVAKPMIDPTTAVTPVSDPEPTATTPVVKPAAAITPTVTKPASTTTKASVPTKPVSTSATPSDSVTASKAKATTSVKKPVTVKKKGTR
jgi:hypothetical protein